MWMLLLVAYGQRDPNAFFLNQHIRNSFSRGISDSMSLGEVFTWANTSLLSNLFGVYPGKYIHLMQMRKKWSGPAVCCPSNQMILCQSCKERFTAQLWLCFSEFLFYTCSYLTMYTASCQSILFPSPFVGPWLSCAKTVLVWKLFKTLLFGKTDFSLSCCGFKQTTPPLGSKMLSCHKIIVGFYTVLHARGNS